MPLFFMVVSHLPPPPVTTDLDCLSLGLARARPSSTSLVGSVLANRINCRLPGLPCTCSVSHLTHLYLKPRPGTSVTLLLCWHPPYLIYSLRFQLPRCDSAGRLIEQPMAIWPCSSSSPSTCLATRQMAGSYSQCTRAHFTAFYCLWPGHQEPPSTSVVPWWSAQHLQTWLIEPEAND